MTSSHYISLNVLIDSTYVLTQKSCTKADINWYVMIYGLISLINICNTSTCILFMLTLYSRTCEQQTRSDHLHLSVVGRCPSYGRSTHCTLLTCCMRKYISL